MVPAFAAKTSATAGGADYAPKDAAVDAEVIEMVMTFLRAAEAGRRAVGD